MPRSLAILCAAGLGLSALGQPVLARTADAGADQTLPIETQVDATTNSVGRDATIWSLVPTPVQAPSDAQSLANRAAQLDEATLDALLHDAIAATGCILPIDLVGAFDIFMVSRGMAHLGLEITEAEAMAAFFAARDGRTLDDHPHGAALVEVARATRGYVSLAIRDGRLRLDRAVFLTETCTPSGTIFVLSPYVHE